MRRHAGPFKAARKFVSQEDVGQFGLFVTAKATVDTFGVQVIEGDVRALPRRPW